MKNNKFEQYVLKTINKFSPILLLERHTWEIRYGLENSSALMECVFNYPYLNVIIKYGKEVVTDWKKGKDIVPYIVHEMSHVITDPLYAKATERYVTKGEIRDERELLTDYICNIVIKGLKR